MKTQINSGYLLPGTRLIEEDLAGRHRVSRTVVREVVKQLAVEGLVELAPYKGATVATISVKDLEDFYRIQQDLEGLASYLAVKHLDNNAMKQLEKIHQNSLATVQDDVLAWQRWNARFHQFFLTNCNNSRLVKLVENHRDQFGRHRFLAISIPGSIKGYMEEHERIVQAVKARRPNLARRLMEKHIADGVKKILEIIRTIYPSEFNP